MNALKQTSKIPDTRISDDADDHEENTGLPKTGVIIPLEVRCRDCYHFKHQRANGYNDICSKLGILPAGRPCGKFLPNVTMFDLHNAEGENLRDFIGHIPANKLLAYAALLMRERVTRRQGLLHGEMVYVRLFPEDYLSNYARAWVIMASTQRVFVQGTETRFRGTLLRNSILDAEQFARKRRALVARKRLVDPELSKYTTWRPKNKLDLGYEPPVIDGVMQESKKTDKHRRRRKQSKGMSIISMRG